MEFTASGRLTVRVTAADVGKRVSVRSLTGAPDSEGKFTDTVGVLTSWTADVLRLTRRDGRSVTLDRASVVAAKVVPPAPARRRGLPSAGTAELTRAAARGWPAVETGHLGDWLLQASGGFTRRANSVIPTGEPRLPLDEALSRVNYWYRTRELTPRLQLALGAEGTDEVLAARLADRGWSPEVTAELQVAGLAQVADRSGGEDVVLSRTVDAGWLLRYRGLTDPRSEVLRVLHGGPSVWFATVPGPAPDEAPAATGRVVVDGRWAGFSAVEVAPEARRRGVATAVMAALARRALEEGASAAWLQVEADNGGARSLYSAMGFATHHSYQHWCAPRS